VKAARNLIVLVLVVLGGASAVVRDMDAQMHAPLKLAEPQVFEIVKGQRLYAIVAELGAHQWLPSARAKQYLKLYVRLKPELASVKAGEYEVTPGMNTLDVLALFASGRVILHELRIVEGWRFAQALEAVQQNDVLVHTLPATASAADVMAALGHPDQEAEGRFFPDTYRFPRGTTDVAYLRRAYAAAEKNLDEQWRTRADGLPYRSPYDALIMASIIERETAVPDERAMIAGVFVRRLAKGMRLQTDPTVIYGLGAAFDGNLRKRDLLADAPYNTYTRAGLPPTPICLPGRASLVAAMHPAAGDALYFVSRGDGTHQFSSTLAEHDAAVRKYQLAHKP
jgi:UPF0755 protein